MRSTASPCPLHAVVHTYRRYELSMHRLLCIYPSLPQFNFHPTKNSGLPRDRERDSFICNSIRLYIFEVYINNGLSQGCNDYSCSAYSIMPPNEKKDVSECMKYPVFDSHWHIVLSFMKFVFIKLQCYKNIWHTDKSLINTINFYIKIVIGICEFKYRENWFISSWGT